VTSKGRVKFKNKGCPVPAVKAYRCSGGVAPLILNLDTKKAVVNIKHPSLYSRYPLHRRLGWTKEHSGILDKTKIFAPAGNITPDCPARSLVAIKTTIAPVYKLKRKDIKWLATEARC
jgi:hypothetical protein